MQLIDCSAGSSLSLHSGHRVWSSGWLPALPHQIFHWQNLASTVRKSEVRLSFLIKKYLTDLVLRIVLIYFILCMNNVQKEG